MLMWPFGNAGGLATLHGELHFQLDLCILAPTPPTGKLRDPCRLKEEWAGLSVMCDRWWILGKLCWGLELCSKGRVLQICSGLGMWNDAFLAEPLNTYDKMCNNTRQLYALSLKADKVAGHVLQIEVWKFNLYIYEVKNTTFISLMLPTLYYWVVSFVKRSCLVTFSDQWSGGLSRQPWCWLKWSISIANLLKEWSCSLCSSKCDLMKQLEGVGLICSDFTSYVSTFNPM